MKRLRYELHEEDREMSELRGMLVGQEQELHDLREQLVSQDDALCSLVRELRRLSRLLHALWHIRRETTLAVVLLREVKPCRRGAGSPGRACVSAHPVQLPASPAAVREAYADLRHYCGGRVLPSFSWLAGEKAGLLDLLRPMADALRLAPAPRAGLAEALARRRLSGLSYRLEALTLEEPVLLCAEKAGALFRAVFLVAGRVCDLSRRGREHPAAVRRFFASFVAVERAEGEGWVVAALADPDFWGAGEPLAVGPLDLAVLLAAGRTPGSPAMNG